jgi:uncharacterized protein
MTIVKKYPPGRFCWTDLGTTDVASAKRFYQSLFGFTAKDIPMNEAGDKYTMLRVRGKDACALYPMSTELKKMKTKPSWLPFISVKSVDAAVNKVVATGGKICTPAMDVARHGRMAVVQDPTGAPFALWQAREHIGARIEGVPGTVRWHDLSTPDPKKASHFYADVFGWKTKELKFPAGSYYQLLAGKTGLGGIWPEPIEKLPASWVSYWLVKDCDKAVAAARRLGGRVVMKTTLVPEYCRFAVLADRQKAAFAVLEPLM